MYLRKSKASSAEKTFSSEEQQAKINEVRGLLGPLANKLPNFCSDASILRYLRARNWDAEKASKMLKATLKWRLQYKPEAIRWEDIANEAETGKIYKANYLDKYGRAVLVMRPGFQNTSSTKGQIRYLVYCLENAILNLAPNQEQMVWLIDFQGWTMASISVKVTGETAHVLQDYYPERLALAILYNPPRIFESFWKVVKPFLDQKTYKKVKFVYSDDGESQKIMTDLFDMNVLESAFGGYNQVGFDFNKYAEQMKEDDKKMSAFLNSGGSVFSQDPSLVSILQQPEPSTSEALLQGSLDSSSSSDTESPESVEIQCHVKNSTENEPKMNTESEALLQGSGGSVLSQDPSLVSILQKPEPSTSEALLQGSLDSSSSSDTESPESVHVKNSTENEQKLQLNCSSNGVAASEVQPELIQMRESA